MSAGIPAATTELTVAFPYGDLAATEELLTRYQDEVACLILEAATQHRAAARLPRRPARAGRPARLRPGLRRDDHRLPLVRGGRPGPVRRRPRPVHVRQGAGQRLRRLRAGRAPRADGAGRAAHSGDRVFLLSTTHGAETHSLAAAMAVHGPPTPRRASPRGCTPSASGWPPVSATPRPAWASATTSSSGAGPATWSSPPSTRTGSRRSRTAPCSCASSSPAGCSAPSFVVSSALTDDDIDRTVDVVAQACAVYRKALDAGDPTPWLGGRPVKPVFRRLA